MLLTKRIRRAFAACKKNNKPYVSNTWDIAFRCTRPYRDELGNTLVVGRYYKPFIHKVNVNGWYTDFLCFGDNGKAFTITMGMVEHSLSIVYRASLQPNEYWAKVLRDLQDIERGEYTIRNPEMMEELTQFINSKRASKGKEPENNINDKFEVRHIPYESEGNFDDELSYDFLKIEE